MRNKVSSKQTTATYAALIADIRRMRSSYLTYAGSTSYLAQAVRELEDAQFVQQAVAQISDEAYPNKQVAQEALAQI